jgi:S-sulfo-L-cysteine synthase (O-acetyl-L-serine-dependent)
MFTDNKIKDVQQDKVLARIGNTPLLVLDHIVENPRVKLSAKAEWFNPGGSIKDRAALNMVLDGERTGALKKGKTIIDATSGNTGISYAMIGSLLGYRVELVVPANISLERKRIVEAFGGVLTYSDPLEGTDGAQDLVKAIVARKPEVYFYPDQYNNASNWQSHYESTGPEILRQTNGAITHFVCGLGTTGTFVGTARLLKETDPSIQCISVQPDSAFHGLEGLKYLPAAKRPGIYDAKLADQNVEVSTEAAYAMVKRLARQEGLLVGVSSGAAAVAAIDLTKQIDEGVIVTIFPDDASKYLSDKFWER